MKLNVKVFPVSVDLLNNELFVKLDNSILVAPVKAKFGLSNSQDNESHFGSKFTFCITLAKGSVSTLPLLLIFTVVDIVANVIVFSTVSKNSLSIVTNDCVDSAGVNTPVSNSEPSSIPCL